MTKDEIRSAAIRKRLTAFFEEVKNPHAVALGRLGGSVKSAAKSAASRANGKKGGAPKKAKA